MNEIVVQQIIHNCRGKRVFFRTGNYLPKATKGKRLGIHFKVHYSNNDILYQYSKCVHKNIS